MDLRQALLTAWSRRLAAAVVRGDGDEISRCQEALATLELLTVRLPGVLAGRTVGDAPALDDVTSLVISGRRAAS